MHNKAWVKKQIHPCKFFFYLLFSFFALYFWCVFFLIFKILFSLKLYSAFLLFYYSFLFCLFQKNVFYFCHFCFFLNKISDLIILGLEWTSTHQCTIHWMPIITQVVDEPEQSYKHPSTPMHLLTYSFESPMHSHTYLLYPPHLYLPIHPPTQPPNQPTHTIYFAMLTSHDEVLKQL